MVAVEVLVLQVKREPVVALVVAEVLSKPLIQDQVIMVQVIHLL